MIKTEFSDLKSMFKSYPAAIKMSHLSLAASLSRLAVHPTLTL